MIALLAYVAVAVLILLTLVDHPGQLIAAWVASLVGLTGAWIALTRRGIARLAGAVLGVAGFAVTVVVLLGDTALLQVIAIAAVWALAVGRRSLRGRRRRCDAARAAAARTPGSAPQRPVLLMNPWSGGGKVGQVRPRPRGRAAGHRDRRAPAGRRPRRSSLVTRSLGAPTCSGMAGGDGSQALVAGDRERARPAVRVHPGRHPQPPRARPRRRPRRRRRLARRVHGRLRAARSTSRPVNGSVFVNNVSLGVYAAHRAVRRVPRREAADRGERCCPSCSARAPTRSTSRSSTRTAPSSITPVSCSSRTTSTSSTRLGGFGSRARLDEGVLGVVTLVVQDSTDVAQLVTLETAGRIDSFRGWRGVERGHGGGAFVAPRRRGCRRRGGVLPLAGPVRDQARGAAGAGRPPRPGISPAHAAERVRHAGLKTLFRVATGRVPT